MSVVSGVLGGVVFVQRLAWDVDAVKAEGVRVDDAVYAAVSGASEMVPSSIADALKEIEDGLLEAPGGDVGEGVEDVGLVRSEGFGLSEL